jgi:hypothetical protein
MNQAEVETFVTQLNNVQQEENYGYIFFFVGDDHLLPFVTIANSDNEYDSVSNLSREGVFRINIGVSRETFEELFADASFENLDYSALNVFLPHPEYATQHFICILSPSQENEELAKKLIVEAHSRATARYQRKAGK